MEITHDKEALPNRKPPTEQDIIDELKLRSKKYLRGKGANLKGLKDKKLRSQLVAREKLYGESAKAAAQAEKWIMPSDQGFLEAEGLEKTYRIKQETIAREVDILSSRNQYDITLPELGPYTLDFTPSGRYMAVGGRKGHLAIVDMMNLSLIRELQVRETVRDVAFLHNELFFAAAQKKYSYIYSREGTELHCLKDHGSVLRLQFLKNHFLLASTNKFGMLLYQDVSTGDVVGKYRTGLGRTNVMQVNPYNSVVSLGHSAGTVTMWKPTSSSPLVKMLCHHGPVSALAFHPNGHIMATAGKDKKIKLWDLRKYEAFQTLPGHANTLEFSQKGLLACGNGSYIQVLRDVSGAQNYSSYMTHSMVKGYQIGKLAFRPYEDVLGIGHSMGWSSILIPGAGEPNFDSWVANPFETPKQRKEKEVQSLRDKLPVETIMLDPSKIGTVKFTKKEKPTVEKMDADMEAAVEAVKGKKLKKKTKGRSKAGKIMPKKQDAIATAKRPYLEQKIQEEKKASSKKQKTNGGVELPKSLQRFAHKKPSS
ncbi:unnamed protein product [Vicia faba]|uniref:BING4 C-terminal domain-containing protein n=1 Tax=Vicia faba TaxID=3906 RepID=A0AAV1A0D6_VICFA|nr:unnamed protein product [Vicia faba]